MYLLPWDFSKAVIVWSAARVQLAILKSLVYPMDRILMDDAVAEPSAEGTMVQVHSLMLTEEENKALNALTDSMAVRFWSV